MAIILVIAFKILIRNRDFLKYSQIAVYCGFGGSGGWGKKAISMIDEAVSLSPFSLSLQPPPPTSHAHIISLLQHECPCVYACLCWKKRRSWVQMSSVLICKLAIGYHWKGWGAVLSIPNSAGCVISGEKQTSYYMSTSSDRAKAENKEVFWSSEPPASVA